MVDDEPETLRALELLLNAWGYDVRTASDGRDALGRVSSRRVDLVLTDLSMPVMDGVDLCLGLKKMPAARDIPIIVTSALQRLPSPLEGLVNAFMRKPLDVERLREALATHGPHSQQNLQLTETDESEA